MGSMRLDFGSAAPLARFAHHSESIIVIPGGAATAANPESNSPSIAAARWIPGLRVRATRWRCIPE